MRVKSRKPLTEEQIQALKDVEEAEKKYVEAIRNAWLLNITGAKIAKAGKTNIARVHRKVSDIRKHTFVTETSSGISITDNQKKMIVKLILEGDEPQWKIAELVGCHPSTIIEVWKRESHKWNIKPRYGKSLSLDGNNSFTK